MYSVRRFCAIFYIEAEKNRHIQSTKRKKGQTLASFFVIKGMRSSAIPPTIREPVPPTAKQQICRDG